MHILSSRKFCSLKSHPSTIKCIFVNIVIVVGHNFEFNRQTNKPNSSSSWNSITSTQFITIPNLKPKVAVARYYYSNTHTGIESRWESFLASWFPGLLNFSSSANNWAIVWSSSVSDKLKSTLELDLVLELPGFSVIIFIINYLPVIQIKTVQKNQKNHQIARIILSIGKHHKFENPYR